MEIFQNFSDLIKLREVREKEDRFRGAVVQVAGLHE